MNVKAREILDSRGHPTIEAEVLLDTNAAGLASIPSGASTGTHEAVEKRDGDAARYRGKGVQQLIQTIHRIIAPELQSISNVNQNKVDECLIKLDGTKNKNYLGANATLAVSLATARALAQDKKQTLFESLANKATSNFILPVPLMNILNGGAHADNNVDIQEFMIMPLSSHSFSEALRYGAEVFQALKSILKENSLGTSVGDEGGFAPNLSSNEQAIELLLEAIHQAGFNPGRDIYLALDIASTELFKEGVYHLASEKRQLTPKEFIDYQANFVRQYPILSIEDGLAEEDWDNWSVYTKTLGKRLQLVGDDLFVTNTNLLQQGIQQQVGNAILIKPNQIGTLTETIAAIELAQSHDYGVIVSHRSGETEDTFIADLAVGVSAGQIKTGSLCRTDRVAKYNQLLRIEECLGAKATYAGSNYFKKFL